MGLFDCTAQDGNGLLLDGSIASLLLSSHGWVLRGHGCHFTAWVVSAFLIKRNQLVGAVGMSGSVLRPLSAGLINVTETPRELNVSRGHVIDSFWVGPGEGEVASQVRGAASRLSDAYHQHRSDLHCGAFRFIEMRPHAEHSCSKSVYPEQSLPPPPPRTPAIFLRVGCVIISFSADITWFHAMFTLYLLGEPRVPPNSVAALTITLLAFHFASCRPVFKSQFLEHSR